MAKMKPKNKKSMQDSPEELIREYWESLEEMDANDNE